MTGLVITLNPYHIKWNSLKRDYENLIRIMTDNRQKYPIRSPNSYFNEMGDEFWTVTSNYLFYLGNLFYIIYYILGVYRQTYRQLNATNNRYRYQLRSSHRKRKF